MKLTSLHGLEKAEGSLFLVVARDDYDREQAEKILVGDKEPTVVLGESARRLMDELESASLFASQRVVLVRGAERLPAAIAQEVARYCDRPNQAVMLVMTAAAKPHASLYKSFDKEGVLVDVAALKPWEQERLLAEWLVSEARQRGAQLTAASQLVGTVGTEKGLLIQELEKLITYVDGKGPIDAAAVAALAVGVPTEAVWGLGQAIFASDGRRAAAVWRDLLGQGVAPLAVIATLRSQIHKGLTLASLAARGATRQEMASALPQLRERALYKALQEAEKYGLARLRQALLLLSDLELQLKSRALPERTAIDILLQRLAA
jgi:DNA polymerase III subunit delta